VIQSYKEKNPGVKIELVVAPYDNYVKLNTLLAAGMAPDLVRVQYQMLGRYSAADILLDLSEYLEPGYGDAFTPAMWQAVNYKDRPYAMPHHTDTMAVFYNTDIFDKLGIEVPQSLDESWTWDEFMNISKRIKKSGEAPYPFAMAWQDVNSAYRWMWFLFQHGGQLLKDDLTGPQIDNSAGVDTIAYTKSWFDENLVPPSTSIKSVQTIESLFAEGTTAMMLNGEWLIPFLETGMTAGWDVTYMIRDVQMAADMGGNGVAATRDTKNPELAADFLKHLVSEEQMKSFCREGLFLPTRKSLVDQGIDFPSYPEQMNLFVEQSTTVPAKMAAEQTVPLSPLITQELGNELEQAFKIGQSAEETAKNVSEGIEKIFEQ
jgi:multiple sugar transport system substrate-binding protein